MANIFDYMDWRDIELTSVPFNEIDNLILSRLSYFPFDGVVDSTPITIHQAYEIYEFKKYKGAILQKEDIDFFPKLAYSKRFGEIKLVNYVNKIDTTQEKQFSAVTILLPDNTIYVSYRGTDDTIIGWKEDFNMSFSEQVPAQIDAVKYLEEIGENYTQKIRVGGHSKGGNLAIYAGIFAKKEIRDRIIAIYNNDGPGFHENVINSKEYDEMLHLIHTYIPQTSIIGRLLDHKEKCEILKSTETGIMQHDLYSWQVLGDKFVKDELTNASKYIDKTITDWLKDVEPKDREKFINTLFEILNPTNAKTLSELNNNRFENSKKMIKAYQDMDAGTRKMMLKTINSLFDIARSNIITRD